MSVSAAGFKQSYLNGNSNLRSGLRIPRKLCSQMLFPLVRQHMVFSAFINNDNINGKHNLWVLTLCWTLVVQSALHISYNICTMAQGPLLWSFYWWVKRGSDKLYVLVGIPPTQLLAGGSVFRPGLSDFKDWTHNHSLFCLPLLPKEKIILSEKGKKLTGISWSAFVTYGKQNGVSFDLVLPTIYWYGGDFCIPTIQLYTP